MLDQKLLTIKAMEICKVGRFLYNKGWAPATSGNYSCRLDQNHILITVSGLHKGELTPEDFMVLDYRSGKILNEAFNSGKKPSAETRLHVSLYQWDDRIGAVLHTHSANATVLSKWYASQQQLQFENDEILKALQKITTPETQEVMPIFPNTQDMASLAEQVTNYLVQYPMTHGYLIVGHGLYTWGRTLSETKRHIEAFEFLFECEMLASQR
jgi:methylthioribulose-1-phosphate dehydratase